MNLAEFAFTAMTEHFDHVRRMAMPTWQVSVQCLFGNPENPSNLGAVLSAFLQVKLGNVPAGNNIGFVYVPHFLSQQIFSFGQQLIENDIGLVRMFCVGKLHLVKRMTLIMKLGASIPMLFFRSIQ